MLAPLAIALSVAWYLELTCTLGLAVCGDQAPHFEIYTSEDRLIYNTRIEHMQNEVSISYGHELRLFCTKQLKVPTAARLELRENGEKLPTITEDENTIAWFIKKPNIHKSEYVCTDNETACTRSVIIAVTPALDVVSTSVRVSNDNFQTNFTVEYGDSMAVLCSGSEVSRLTMKSNGEELTTEIESNNTIKWFLAKPDLQISEYVCTDLDTTVNSSVFIRVEPKIYIQLRNETVMTESYDRYTRTHWYSMRYGDHFEVFCSGPRAVKLIIPGGYNKEVENVNRTTVKTLMTNWGIGELVFKCVDSEVADYVSTAGVTVNLRLDVISANVSRFRRTYTIKYGNPLEIVCSGPDASLLTISKNRIKTLEVQKVNKTTIRWLTNKFEGIDGSFGHDEYACFAGRKKTVVHVAPLPEAVGFGCLSYDLDYLKCSWEAPSKSIKFTLFYITNSTSTAIYESPEQLRKHKSYQMNISFVWSSTAGYSSDVKTFSFLMRSCHKYFGCVDQTFLIDHLSVVRPSPPHRLEVAHVTAVGATLRWYSAEIVCAGQHLWSELGDFQYKVEYWHAVIDVQRINESLITCQFAFCEVVLILPKIAYCSDQFYEVRVYQKLTKTIGEQFWSDPASTSFITNGRDHSTVDPTCIPTPKITKGAMVYFVQKLRHDVVVKMRELKGKLKALKKEVTRVRNYEHQP